jgi:hypothetical protein
MDIGKVDDFHVTVSAGKSIIAYFRRQALALGIGHWALGVRHLIEFEKTLTPYTSRLTVLDFRISDFFGI